MKNKELIAALQQFDPEIEVALLDILMNQAWDDGDGSSAGIYGEFDFEHFPSPDDENPDGRLPWIGICFINQEYKEQGEEKWKCRVCGCTDDNCHQCIEKTGGPCDWVEKNLCSACAPAANSLLLPGVDF